MTTIAISQRVDLIEKYNERRDALDQRWSSFLEKCDLTPLLLPNNLKVVESMLNEINVDGVLLTGGNDLVEYGGDAKDRDDVEKYLIEQAIEKKIPLLGVCRGMQMLLHYFNIPLHSIDGHAGTKHEIIFRGIKRTVNSYHNFAALKTSESMEIEAISQDDVVEAIKHNLYKLYGIMWHPERNVSIDHYDLELFNEIFSAN